MSHIKTIAEADAANLLKDIYDADRKASGYVPNHAKILSLRPQVLEAWRKLIGSIRGNLRLRQYELVTFAAAKRLNCRYCMLAHSDVLLKNFFSVGQMIAIATNYTNAGLPPEEVAMMTFAEKVVEDASAITQDDIDDLRRRGLNDATITDIALTAAARCFFSKVLDSLGAVPDEVYQGMDPRLRDVLAVGASP